MISRAASIVVFFAALIGTGTLLSEIQPFATVPVLREKFAWFAAHADEYDTLFVGTSRIYRGIKPAVFDEFTAAAGVPTHSFNLGIDAMVPPEDAYVFERIAALRPKRLRWVFIETNPMRSTDGYGGNETVRSVHWRDHSRTWLALRAVLAPSGGSLKLGRALFGSKEERQPLDRAATHVKLWFTRTLNAGRGASFLQARLAPPPRVHRSSILGKPRDGFVPMGDGRPMTERERALYDQRVKEPGRIVLLDRDAQHGLNDMIARLGTLGARPILVIAPAVGRTRQYPQPGCDAPVFDYGDVAKWPQLYQVENRVDRGHVNAAGADLFTRALAADFIELARPPAR